MGENSSIRSIGIIGTPGCGKTTLCAQLELPVISLRDFALQHGCLGPIESDGAAPIDVEKLAKLWQQPSQLSLVDSHLAHHMPVDAIVVLRCHPDELKSRLELRNYSAEKVQANVEVEMLGGPWGELLDDIRPVFEGIDGVQEWIKAGCPQHTTPELAIDWLSQP
ncbi:MAG: AAA family ATPase [Euryarchaeota archaeon]|jgi:adenylate kinase|nr:AAA family ATPase [Euryarchaeota archaeon]MBT5184300.1 AAA family ATPase [Euryarchaeota archaeon]